MNNFVYKNMLNKLYLNVKTLLSFKIPKLLLKIVLLVIVEDRFKKKLLNHWKKILKNTKNVFIIFYALSFIKKVYS